MAATAVKGDVGGCSGLRATGLDDADSQAAELGPMPAARDAGKFLGAQEEPKQFVEPLTRSAAGTGYSRWPQRSVRAAASSRGSPHGGSSSSRLPAATLPRPWRLKHLLGVCPPSWPSPRVPGQLPRRGHVCTAQKTLPSSCAAERAARSQRPRFPRPESPPTSCGLPTVPSRLPGHTASSERLTPRPLTGLRPRAAPHPLPSPSLGCEVHALAHQPRPHNPLSPATLSEPHLSNPRDHRKLSVTSCSSCSTLTRYKAE